MRAVVIDDVAVLEPHLPAWDALAAARGRPFCAPAWMLGWWREAREGDARLRVVLVRDGDELVGVGPFFAQIGRLGLNELRLLGAGFCHRIGPLAAAGRDEAVGAAIGGALAATRPRPASVVFEGIELAERWPELVAAGWPGRRPPRLRTDVVMDAPVVRLDESFDVWLDRRARKFRKEARRTARRLADEGVTTRFADDDRAFAALMRLHHARWDGRGGTNVDGPAGRAVAAAGAGLRGSGRLEVALLEAPEGPVAAELVLRAGAAVAFWGGGFDPAWSRHAPGTQTMLAVLEAAAAAGATEADLGGGEHEYKRRLADVNRPVAWRTLFPRGWRFPLIRARLAPKHARFALRERARRLPPAWQDRLRRLARAVRVR
jgi:CelD/BcsL family acetyltransferase involved in cellulose biosynthesis